MTLKMVWYSLWAVFAFGWTVDFTRDAVLGRPIANIRLAQLTLASFFLAWAFELCGKVLDICIERMKDEALDQVKVYPSPKS